MRWTINLLLVMLLAACGPSPQEQAVAQRTHGETLYTQQCAACHDIQQGIGPTLTPEVVASYKTAPRLFSYLRLAMPTQAPGNLPEDDYWAITAYLLQSRDLHITDQPLTAETGAAVQW